MCSHMVVCVYIPRFELTVAAGGSRALAGRALALAPRVGGEPRIGQVSGAAQACGVKEGMAIAEALVRCPELELVPADPLAAAESWEGVLGELESIGAAVEAASAGIAYFEADGLRGMHGSQERTIAHARRAIGRPARIGVAPSRFCALAAAMEAGARRAKIIDARSAPRYLAAAPIDLLSLREQTAVLTAPLTRLGVRTLGELRSLGCAALADRFGDAGTLAYRLAGGDDDPLVPRTCEDFLEESLSTADASSGMALERVLGLLVDRLLARQERRGRTLRVLVLSARLAGGGTWSERIALRQALCDPERINLALSVRLALLPAPAEWLRLRVECFGPAGGEQLGLSRSDAAARRERMGEAVSQVRAAAGHDAALRAVLIDPDSRVPERRAALTPLQG
jgi:nucleotidyltransferase/DNA polymerase involved in DNA repair